MKFTLLNCLLICLIPFCSQAQQSDDWVGDWTGDIEIPGTAIGLIVHLNVDGSGSLDIPMQGASDMALTDIFTNADSIYFRIPDIPGNANYSGKRTGKTINGNYEQSGQRFTTNLKRNNTSAPTTTTSSNSTSQAAVADDPPPALEEKIVLLKALADSLRIKAEVPGLGFGIYYKGEVILTEGFGQRNVAKNLPVTANSLFAIGSSSKAFTALGVALLEDQGKIGWDDKIKTHLPDFQLMDKFATEEMNPVDLLCHRSGLPRHDLAWYLSDASRDELYQRLRHLPPNKSFRSGWEYQNLMYMTAGILIEKVTGQSWEDFTEDQIFKPLGMASSLTNIPGMAKTADHTLGYQKKDDEVVEMPYYKRSAIAPAGMISSSVNDMLKWVAFNLGDGKIDGNKVISTSNLNKLHKPHMVMSGGLFGALPGFSMHSYALGWFIENNRGHRVVQHGGNIDGYSALVMMFPDDELGMVMLTNLNGNGLGYALGYSAADIILDREPNNYSALFIRDASAMPQLPEPPRVEATKYQHELAAYTGTYLHPGYGEIDVKEKDGSLVAMVGEMEMPLEHWHFESFMASLNGSAPSATSLMNFHTDPTGKISHLSTSAEPNMDDLIFEKQAERTKGNDPNYLGQFVGTYELAPGRNLDINLKGEQLSLFIAGQPEYDLNYEDDHNFDLPALPGFSAEFIIEDGKVKELIMHQPNGDYPAKKL